ncbi:MAG: MBL fold metallo-hydrolase [Candidatus Pacebacteria bacterium]|nr:MBL fold metallo-hydrolase [Candidatus Paceibacterota bacterium]
MKKPALAVFSLLVLANVFSWAAFSEARQPKPLTADFFNIGQGDFSFIETPEGNQIVVDAGPDYNKAAEKLSAIMPFWDRTIDLVIITHPEEDHFAGVFGILKSYKIGKIAWTGVAKETEKFKELEGLINEQKEKYGTAIFEIKAGDRILAGSAQIDVLFPFFVNKEAVGDTSNDSSLVLRLDFQKNSMLFTGDISSNEEAEIMARGENIKTDILKVAHHGSKYSTSEEFLAQSTPKLAIIQSGINNPYGHPSAEVLTRLDDFGIKIVRNDFQGDVKILSDGKNLQIITRPVAKTGSAL